MKINKIYMIKKLICVMICCCLLTGGIVSVSGQSQQTQSLSSKAKKMKEKIEKIGKGNDLTITQNNGAEFYGSVLSIENNQVLIAEIDQKKTVEIKYEDIKDVRKNYGSIKGSTGKRLRPRTVFIVGAIIIGGALLIHALTINKKKTPSPNF